MQQPQGRECQRIAPSSGSELRTLTPPTTLIRRGVNAGPLYFAVRNAKVVVGGQLAPLVRSVGSAPNLRADVLCAWLLPRLRDEAELTPYRGIVRVPAHHEVTIRADGTHTLKKLDTTIAAAPRMTAQDAAEMLREKLFAAIRRAIGSKRRVAVLTGGGVDSSAILGAMLAIARGASPREVHAIALHFAARGDDRPYMRSMADSLGILPIRVRPEEAGPHVVPCLVADGLPLYSANAALHACLLFRARELGAETVLTGVGGDDVLDGSPSYLADRAARGNILGAVRDSRTLEVFWRDPGVTQIWDFVVRPLLVRALPLSVRRARQRRVVRRRADWAGPALLAQLKRRHPVDMASRSRAPSARFEHFMGSPTLGRRDDGRGQFFALTGIEQSDPFLDEEFVRFVFSLDPSLLHVGGRGRGLLRLAMEGLVPDDVRQRLDKSRFEPAMSAMMQGAGGFQTLAPLSTMKRAGRLGLVDPAAFGRSFDRLRTNPDWGAGWTYVWPPLALEAFLASHD